MCDTRSTTIIDECLRAEIARINDVPHLKTLLSCCGHGKYPPSIIVKDKVTGMVYEHFTKIQLENRFKNGHHRTHFYRMDGNGYYYLPEIVKGWW